LTTSTTAAHTLTITPGSSFAVSAGDQLVLTLVNVTNPAAGSISDFFVNTNVDPVPQPAASFTITPATTGVVTSAVTVTVSPTTQGSLATYTISGLQANAAIAAGSTITVTGGINTGGIVFPNLNTDYQITDSTTSSGSGTATAVSSSGTAVTITVPNAINSGDRLTLTISDVVNPSSSTPAAQLNISGALAAATSTVPVFPVSNTTYPNAAIVNFSGTYYVFAGGHAFGCPTPAQLIGVQAVDHAVVQTAAVGTSVPNSTPRPGTLIHVYNSATIYVVGTDGDLHGFATPTQFLQDGYDSALVITVPTLGGLTVSTSTVGSLGSAANALATSSDGAIINNSGTFYLFAGGRAFGIATPTQLMAVQAGNYTSTVLSGSISSAAMSATIANGVIVTLNGTVYISNNGMLFAFKSMAQLTADGYGGTPSIILPNAGALTLVTSYTGS
jgi:hypothetical protein